MKIKILTITTVIAALLMAGCWGKSDADLAKDASDAIKADSATSGVTVEVKDGVATIKGEVADEAAKATAESKAKVEGIKSVINEVTVAPPPPIASAADPELKTKVEDALKKVGCDGATVELNDGVATLRGSVVKGKMGECVRAANEAKPRRVENQLTEK